MNSLRTIILLALLGVMLLAFQQYTSPSSYSRVLLSGRCNADPKPPACRPPWLPNR